MTTDTASSSLTSRTGLLFMVVRRHSGSAARISLGAILALLLVAPPTFASLEFDAGATLSGQVLGAVATVLTVQKPGSESGCVA